MPDSVVVYLTLLKTDTSSPTTREESPLRCASTFSYFLLAQWKHPNEPLCYDCLQHTGVPWATWGGEHESTRTKDLKQPQNTAAWIKPRFLILLQSSLDVNSRGLVEPTLPSLTYDGKRCPVLTIPQAASGKKVSRTSVFPQLHEYYPQAIQNSRLGGKAMPLIRPLLPSFSLVWMWCFNRFVRKTLSDSFIFISLLNFQSCEFHI